MNHPVFRPSCKMYILTATYNRCITTYSWCWGNNHSFCVTTQTGIYLQIAYRVTPWNQQSSVPQVLSGTTPTEPTPSSGGKHGLEMGSPPSVLHAVHLNNRAATFQSNTETLFCSRSLARAHAVVWRDDDGSVTSVSRWESLGVTRHRPGPGGNQVLM